MTIQQQKRGHQSISKVGNVNHINNLNNIHNINNVNNRIINNHNNYNKPNHVRDDGAIDDHNNDDNYEYEHTCSGTPASMIRTTTAMIIMTTATDETRQHNMAERSNTLKQETSEYNGHDRCQWRTGAKENNIRDNVVMMIQRVCRRSHHQLNLGGALLLFLAKPQGRHGIGCPNEMQQ